MGKGDNEAFKLVLSKSFRFITAAMVITCAYVWIWPESVAAIFGANEADLIAESKSALRLFAISSIPFCYINTILIVYKLYGHHKMALFISFALSLTVIPVLWAISKFMPELLWYSYLIAYIIEILLIAMFHNMSKIKFELSTK